MGKRNGTAGRTAGLCAALALALLPPLAAAEPGEPPEQGLTADLSSVDASERVLRAEGKTFVVPAHMKHVDLSRLSGGQTVTLWWRGEGSGPFELTGLEVVEPH